MHNALKQITIELGSYKVKGFSISGLSTYLQIPELDICFDMGECPLTAVGINHVFLTHAHGDHSRCLMRHSSLRKMLGVEKESVYYIPHFLIDSYKHLLKAEAIFEGIPEERFKFPILKPVIPGEVYPLNYRKDLKFSAFEIKHSQPGLGYIIYDFKNKLKEEYLGLCSKDIIKLRQDGVEITKPVLVPKICFTGDCIGQSLLDNPEIWQAETILVESTFLDDDEKLMATKKGHVHISEITTALEHFESEMKTKNIILTHFSMKYPPSAIAQKVHRAIPERFHKLLNFLVS